MIPYRLKKLSTGFTLIELMVVVLIVAILAAVALPIYRGRINSAKWAEGKVMLGTIATAIRTYAAENGSSAATPTLDFTQGPTSLGFKPGDLTGTYFQDSDFSILSIDLTATPIAFTIHCGTSLADAPLVPTGFTLDRDNGFTAD